MRVMIPALLAAFAAGCAYQQPAQPTPVTSTVNMSPASIRATASSRSDYTTLVTATVLTVEGRFVAGIPIGFATGNGTVSTAATVTDANGSATTIVNTPTTTMVTITIGVLSNSIQVQGSSAPTTGPTPPPITPPTPPTPTPNAIINAPSTVTTGTAITLGVSAPANGQTWTWNFGDGGTTQTTAFTTTHTYTTAGVYTIMVSAPGIATGSATITATSGLVPMMNCTVPATHAAVTCTISATYNGAALPSSSITKVDWDWGDGFTNTTSGSSAPTSSHTYASAGTYTVFATVTATTSDGKSVTTSKTITTP